MTDRKPPPDDAKGDATPESAPGDADGDAFRPFANDSQVMTFADGRGELSIENGTDALLLHGDLELPATADGLATVRALREALARIEAEIESRLT